MPILRTRKTSLSDDDQYDGHGYDSGHGDADGDGVAVGAVVALMMTLALPAAERIAEAALELARGRGVMLAYAKEMALSGAV